MKKILWLAIILILALVVANVSLLSSGSVVIYLAKYRIALSLNFLIALWIISIFLIVFLIKVIRNTINIPVQLSSFFGFNKDKKTEKAYTQSLLYYFCGDYQKAVKISLKLSKYLPESDKKTIFMMISLNSLFQLNDSRINDQLIEFDDFADPCRALLNKLAKARVAILNRRYSEAIIQLQEALVIDKKNILIHQLLLDNYLELDDLGNAKDCFNWLNKRKIMSVSMQKQYQQRLGIAS